ncbi:MAG: DUF2148 domain-containing protein [Methanoregula sp.]
MTVEKTAVTTVAGLMALAARTAPKAKGVDTIFVQVISRRKDLAALAGTMSAYGKKANLGFFLRDAKNIEACDACVLIGTNGTMTGGVNCGGCGYPGCSEFTEACKHHSAKKTPYPGPNCIIRITDLGIAVGSAVKTAQIHNVDNRVMYSAGCAAIEDRLLGKKCTVAYGIPLMASGKNIFFDRPKVE